MKYLICLLENHIQVDEHIVTSSHCGRNLYCLYPGYSTGQYNQKWNNFRTCTCMQLNFELWTIEL